VSGPLVRYENAAISLVALTYLFLRGRYRMSIALGLVVALSLGAFSLFLMSLGLDPLPTSIMAKTAAVAPNGQLGGFALHLRESVTKRSLPEIPPLSDLAEPRDQKRLGGGTQARTVPIRQADPAEAGDRVTTRRCHHTLS